MRATNVTLHKRSRTLEITFENGETVTYSGEHLRVNTPSAEAKNKPVLHKENIAIVKVEPAGHYALKITFEDGHDSGIFTWDYLYSLKQD